MASSVYVALSRQAGLLKELSSVANNIANANTTGFKKQGALFTEYVVAAGQGNPSISMGRLGAHYTSFSQGGFSATGGALDLAIEGEGFFLVNASEGQRLTRAGNFLADATGRLVTAEGFPVLTEGGGEIVITPELSNLVIAEDGTISADGNAVGKIGIVTAPEISLLRRGENLWEAREGTRPAEKAKVRQGFLEDSNVNPIEEIAHLINVQRNYEAGQKIFEQEDDRISQLIRTIRQP